MFNAFKKLASRQDGPAAASSGSGVAASNQPTAANASCVPMSGSLQRKFAKGVQYNSKYINTKLKMLPFIQMWCICILMTFFV